MLPDGEYIYPRAKYTVFVSMCDFTDKYITFTKWPCVLNCLSERPGFFFLMHKLTVRNM